jgi:hypothetical protein
MRSRNGGHPAVEAWRRVGRRGREPERVDTLEQTVKSAVYRLDGAGRGGSSIVAKRGRRDGLLVERTRYLHVLSRLPVATLRYYGFLEEGEGWCWLFLEHADGRAYSWRSAADRVLAGRWLGNVHLAAADLDAQLPDRGPNHYFEEMRAGRDTIVRNLDHPELSPQDRATLEATVAQSHLLEARWGEIDAVCEGMPRTLVHGDFAPQNARVRRGSAGRDLLIFDWEFAGWGVPAVDLAQSTGRLIRPDLVAYWEITRPFWAGPRARGHPASRGARRGLQVARRDQLGESEPPVRGSMLGGEEHRRLPPLPHSGDARARTCAVKPRWPPSPPPSRSRRPYG